MNESDSGGSCGVMKDEPPLPDNYKSALWRRITARKGYFYLILV
ncbi:MAG: hypothetical protein ACE14Q_04860 [Acidobacteriota bacterium]